MTLAPWKKSCGKTRQHIKKQRNHFADKCPSSQSYGFSSSHVRMWELDPKEGWAPKNWCFWTVVLEKALESPLDCKEIQPVHPKGNQSWIFIRRTDAEAEAPKLGPPDAKSWFIGKDPDAGKDWGQEEETTEDEMTGWHHWLDGHEFEQAPGAGDGQGGLVCCSPWGRIESDTTEWITAAYLGLIHVVVRQKQTQHCEAIILQIKINLKNNNNNNNRKGLCTACTKQPHKGQSLGRPPKAQWLQQILSSTHSSIYPIGVATSHMWHQDLTLVSDFKF